MLSWYFEFENKIKSEAHIAALLELIILDLLCFPPQFDTFWDMFWLCFM